MKLKKWLAAALCAAMAVTLVPVTAPANVQAAATAQEREVLNFNTNWLYSNVDYANGASIDLDDSGFDQVSVPHANTLLTKHSAEDFEEQISSYRFISWYRRHFSLPKEYAGRNIRIEFEGVATVAEVYLNGEKLSVHEGAYTGFTVDISDYVYTDGRDNILAVRVDSTRQPQIPPEGGNVDYCLFGGIVRDVYMTITDPVYVERTFVTTPELDVDDAYVKTQIDIKNNLEEDKTYTIETVVKDADGKIVADGSEKEKLTAGKETTVVVETDEVDDAHLWSIDDPYLYTLVTTIKDGTTVVDTYDTSFGMRYFEFGQGPDDGNFYLNGEKVEIVGINRHEQWPWIGRAVPDKLQEQDADLIKANGINAVRCSHYPQDPSFMDRCDEIGLLVFTEAPGWQHIGDNEWKETFKTNLTELILRDRNHPSIISWSATPNESEVNHAFNQECHDLVKSLDPTRPTHGVRWEYDYSGVDGNTGEDNEKVVTDILTVNYQYPTNPHHIPYIVTEHSNDWWGNGRPDANDTNAQAFIDSFAKVLDYYYGNDKVAGGFGWSMFDYNNEVNYTNSQHVFYSGLYDLWRHEKPVAWVYRTQQDADDAGAMVYISNNWTKDTSKTVYVMSNCDEIELFVNDVSKGKIEPNKYINMPHPIFEFKNIAYEDGELKAVGYIDGEEVAECVRTTPGEAVALEVRADYDTLVADGTDMTSVSVIAVDENGNEVPFAANKINVVQTSGVETILISEKDVALEGGAISFLVQSKYSKTGTAEFEVISDDLESGTCTIEIKEFTADNLVPVSEGFGYEEPELPSQFNINDSSVGTGLYQISYDGVWQYGTETTAYNGDNHWTNAAGDSCTIRFEGPNIQYYGAKAPGHGIAAFSLDGGEEVLVDCYAGTRQGSTILFDSGLLDDGEHVLTVRATGQKNASATDRYINTDRIVIDFDYVGASATIDDNVRGTDENQVNYVGTWEYTADGICYNGGNTWSNTVDAYLTFTFTGTSVKYYATLAPDHGIAAVSIDDGEEEMVDLYASARQGDALAYESGQLDDGEHTLTIRVTGDKRNASGGTFVTVDKFEVYDEKPVDKAKLADAIANAIPDSEKDNYTEASWSAYERALAAAKKVNDDADASQKDVDRVIKALAGAQTALKEAEITLPYEDVTKADWFYDAVYYTYVENLMTGMDATHFGPYGNLSRAQFALILYRMEDSPSVTTDKSFGDIAGDEWYGTAVLWAAENGIVTGYTDGNFGPADNITREQMALMMYRYANYLKQDTETKADISKFADVATVSGFASDAIKWANGMGIITGKEGGTKLDPQGNTARCEAAAIIERFMNSYSAK